MFPYTRERIPVIFGIASYEISLEENLFFSDYPPLGFILFKRNIRDANQVSELTQALRELVGEKSIPILIDEEGGTVSRLCPIDKRYCRPEALFFAQNFAALDDAKHACFESYASLASELRSLGITVNCAPVMDTFVPDHTYSSLKSRCFSSDPLWVSELGKAAIQGMKKEKITPVMKHLPGKGCAQQDSHFWLPTVTWSDAEMQSHWKPFQDSMSENPWAMSSHVLFPHYDPVFPGTLSVPIVQNLIRSTIGFQGFLVTDDLYMKALEKYTLKERVHRALEVGHDAALVCFGEPLTWKSAVEGIDALNPQSRLRFACR